MKRLAAVVLAYLLVPLPGFAQVASAPTILTAEGYRDLILSTADAMSEVGAYGAFTPGTGREYVNGRERQCIMTFTFSESNVADRLKAWAKAPVPAQLKASHAGILKWMESRVAAARRVPTCFEPLMQASAAQFEFLASSEYDDIRKNAATALAGLGVTLPPIQQATPGRTTTSAPPLSAPPPSTPPSSTPPSSTPPSSTPPSSAPPPSAPPPSASLSPSPPPSSALRSRADAVAVATADAITDPESRLAALLKIRAENPENTSVDVALLRTLLTWPDRTAEIRDVLDRIAARYLLSTPETRFNGTVALLNLLIPPRVALDRATQLVTDAIAALDFDGYATAQIAQARRLNREPPTEVELRRRFDEQYRARGLEGLGRIHLAQGDTARAEQEFKLALRANARLIAAQSTMLQLYAARGDRASSEAMLKNAIAFELPNAVSGPTIRLANFYVQIGEGAKAEALLLETIKNFKPSGIFSDLSMRTQVIDIYLAKGETKKAQQQLDAFVKAYPFSPIIPDLRAKIAATRK